MKILLLFLLTTVSIYSQVSIDLSKVTSSTKRQTIDGVYEKLGESMTYVFPGTPIEEVTKNKDLIGVLAVVADEVKSKVPLQPFSTEILQISSASKDIVAEFNNPFCEFPKNTNVVYFTTVKNLTIGDLSKLRSNYLILECDNLILTKNTKFPKKLDHIIIKERKKSNHYNLLKALENVEFTSMNFETYED